MMERHSSLMARRGNRRSGSQVRPEAKMGRLQPDAWPFPVVLVTRPGAPARLSSTERQFLKRGMDKKRRQADRHIDPDEIALSQEEDAPDRG
jgi:hypothetical protein